MDNWIVKPITSQEAKPWITQKHYARRMPCVKYAFGLFEFDTNVLIGVVTFGPTPTPAVQKNICGPEWAKYVLELNRLIIDSTEKNCASYLVSHALKQLPKPSIVVSYADGGMTHVGYVYQATNFYFTGTVTAHDAEYLVDGKKVHARTLTARGITSPKKWAKENGITIINPKPKNRYVYIVASKSDKKKILAALKYEIIPEYPKGDVQRYDVTKPTDELIREQLERDLKNVRKM